MTTTTTIRSLAVGLLLLAACDRARPNPVDENLLTREEAVARFRADLPEVTALGGGAPTRDSLVAVFVHALEAGDTAALRRMTLTPAEFIWLYYPSTPQSLPPYDLRPGLMWFMLEANGNRGFRHLLAERAGADLGYVGYRCEGQPSPEGENTVWGPCLLRRVIAPGDTTEERLFGLVIRRGDQVKFVSYTNKLD
ncbi:MAG: hypothetical protein AB7I33_04675 [Gemmatimonadales bacterium]